jgi:hypothetical protein
MITSPVFETSLSLQMAKPINRTTGFNQLLAAAIVNRQFCELLLNNPEAALQTGYQGETFSLTDEEKTIVTSIRAQSLTDLAAQLTMTQHSTFHRKSAGGRF